MPENSIIIIWMDLGYYGSMHWIFLSASLEGRLSGDFLTLKEDATKLTLPMDNSLSRPEF